MTMRQIRVERSEWFSLDAEDATFEHLADDKPITGVQWLALSASDRDHYSLNTRDAETHSLDGDTDHFDVAEHFDDQPTKEPDR